MDIKQTLFDFSKSALGVRIVGLVFGKYSRFLPVQRLKETDKVIAFWHPRPCWEKHIVLVPKKAIKSLTDLKNEDSAFISEIFIIAQDIVKELNLDPTGYSLTMNGGVKQEVSQLHFHLYSGKIIRY